MKKNIIGLFNRLHPSKKDISAILKKRNNGKTICYVLLTCGEPNEEGVMEIEMTYEGDKEIVSYLIKNVHDTLK